MTDLWIEGWVCNNCKTQVYPSTLISSVGKKEDITTIDLDVAIKIDGVDVPEAEGIGWIKKRISDKNKELKDKHPHNEVKVDTTPEIDEEYEVEWEETVDPDTGEITPAGKATIKHIRTHIRVKRLLANIAVDEKEEKALCPTCGYELYSWKT